MNEIKEAHTILEGILSNLGFEATIEEEQLSEGPCLQISSPDSRHLIGESGDRLDDLQYLVNRVLTKKDENATRVRVDCENYRSDQEERLTAEALEAAAEVRETGKPVNMRPLNAYHRRIVHNALVDIQDIATSSPKENSRMKRIMIQLKSS